MHVERRLEIDFVICKPLVGSFRPFFPTLDENLSRDVSTIIEFTCNFLFWSFLVCNDSWGKGWSRTMTLVVMYSVLSRLADYICLIKFGHGFQPFTLYSFIQGYLIAFIISKESRDVKDGCPWCVRTHAHVLPLVQISQVDQLTPCPQAASFPAIGFTKSGLDRGLTFILFFSFPWFPSVVEKNRTKPL